jgi:hypothetical protein
MNRLLLLFPLLGVTVFTFITRHANAEEILLEDYQGGGVFAPADWANTFSDSAGNTNKAVVENKTAVVDWATKWSGHPSTGTPIDVSRFKTFQVDVKVDQGQPLEKDTNFYFQLTSQVNQGFSYWEIFVPQMRIPTDGQWHRVQFPLSQMITGNGDGGDPPKDFKSINGTVCGMTYDDENDQYKLKRAYFDNVTLTDANIDEVSVTKSPKKVSDAN